MESDRIKWDARYAGKDFFFSHGPSKFLAESLELVCALAPGRRALDIACGEGRNGIFLAQNGFEVDAVDISERGLARGKDRAAELGVGVNFIQADLELYQLQGIYDVILNFNFLLRPLIPMMVEALSPGGVIVMETIVDAPSLEGDHARHFLLQQGELQRLFLPFPGRILLVEEKLLEQTPIARLIFRKEEGQG